MVILFWCFRFLNVLSRSIISKFLVFLSQISKYEIYFHEYLFTTGAGPGAQGPPVGPLGRTGQLKMRRASGARNPGEIGFPPGQIGFVPPPEGYVGAIASPPMDVCEIVTAAARRVVARRARTAASTAGAGE